MAALPRGSLASFLNAASSTLHSAIISQQRVTLIIGSDAADLDSIISAIVFAYLKSSAPPNTPLTNNSVNRHQPPNQYPPFYIPIVNASRSSIQARHDLESVLDLAQLSLSQLITIDNLETEPPAGLNPNNISILQPQTTRLVLVGCGSLSGQLSSDFQTCVVGHINNSPAQAATTNAKGSEPQVALEAGSCTSLVIDECRESWSALTLGGGSSAIGSAQDDSIVGVDDSAFRRKWDAQIAKMAMAAILQQTANLTKDNQVTEHDSRACSYLEAKIALADISWDRNTFFNNITKAMNTSS